MADIEKIPLSAIPWQELSVVLDGQNCTIELRQMGHRLYCSLAVDGETVFSNRLCVLGTDVNCYKTVDFNGRLFFVDTLGAEDPQYEGLNYRWLLCFEAEEEED